jgi:hypothetical protein
MHNQKNKVVLVKKVFSGAPSWGILLHIIGADARLQCL